MLIVNKRGDAHPQSPPLPLQSVFHPLIQAEADHDRSLREAQRREGINVRWDTALNKKRLALFYFPQVRAWVRTACCCLWVRSLNHRNIWR